MESRLAAFKSRLGRKTLMISCDMIRRHALPNVSKAVRSWLGFSTSKLLPAYRHPQMYGMNFGAVEVLRLQGLVGFKAGSIGHKVQGLGRGL